MAKPGVASEAELIILLALTTSLVAMSIDSMLPALGTIADDLGAADPNDRQLIVTVFFGGLTLGRLLWGPLSDSTGRKPALYAGMTLFALAGLVCATTDRFDVLLLGRALQGFGAGGPRVVALALVRDTHSGSAMARVMSFVSTVFILVPVCAPLLGQSVLMIAGWRAIFWLLLLVGAVNLVWFAWRQPETLPAHRRVALSLRSILRGAGQTLSNRLALGYTFAMGCVFGGLLSYLSMSQQILQEQYQLGSWFPVVFGGIALMLGVASFVNARLVTRLGMRWLSRRALLLECVLACLFVPIAWFTSGHPPVTVLIGYLAIVFFCKGLLFGNFNARALEPLGQIAGVAAAVMGAVSNLVALTLGSVCGRAYDGTVLPLALGLAGMAALALALTEWAERGAVGSTSG